MKEEFADSRSITLAENYLISEEYEKDPDEEERVEMTEYYPKDKVEYIEFEVMECAEENENQIEEPETKHLTEVIAKNLFKDDSVDAEYYEVDVTDNTQISK